MNWSQVKMKRHNKKRNTAFLFETLVIELTKSIVQKDHKRKHQISEMLKTHFDQKTILRKELDLFMALLETDGLDAKTSEKLLAEAKKQYTNLDKQKIFEQQSALIKKINTTLSKSVFSNFMPNYKDLATVGLFLQDSNIGAKKRIMLEDKMVSFLGRKEQTLTEMKHLDKLEFKMFVDRFNSTYEHSLLKEQKELLGNFITSYSDNGLGLKVYLNNEIGRLKEAVSTEITEGTNEALTENFKKVKAKLDGYAKTPLNEAVVEEIFYIQDLLAEVKRNGN